MCPICITTAVALASGTGGAAGLIALLLGKWRRR